MKKINYKKLWGFTLIELVVVVGVFGIILITMSTILINSTRAKNRTAIIQNLDINGNRILDKIKYNLINADPSTIVCPVGGVGSSMAFIDKMGVGDSTVLICSEGAGVASKSASNGTLGLNADSVTVSGCGNFISCSPVSGEVQNVNIGFTLAAGDVNAGAPQESSISRNFQTSVTVRK